ncbi:hypothetical protein [Leptospira sp. GIMC2001]|uniref:hypothetical protein n=1 Tax=Leptospira sp. GIMC2001 TaxID=1513297 RepID=UPI002348FBCA|nr:hypothetical protein [Leptospira sp. GIMC2001]WCL49425.1 hypothetical protein O4O04_19370 [Leptospira sp. GIMC2001]
MDKFKNGDQIKTSLGPSLTKEADDLMSIDLSKLQIFWGLSILSRTLGDEIVQRIQSYPGDISFLHKINPNINSELLEMHIGYIQIHARAGVLKDILLFRDEFQDHLRCVFGTFQRQVWAKIIHPEFYGEDPKFSPSKALVFPFHHTSPNENVDYQFILERVQNQVEPGEFLFRLTIENFDRANLDLKSLPHVVVEDLKSRIYIAGSTKISESIHSSVIGGCQKGESDYSEENRRFNRVFEQIQKTALGSLTQINFFWEQDFARFLLTSDPLVSLPIFKKLFLMLEDQEVTRCIKEGYTIKVDLGSAIVYLDLSRLDRVLNYSFNRRRKAQTLGYYLSRMPELEDVADRKEHKLNLSGLRVYLIHHITSEILALIEAFRRLDAKSITVSFVKYGGNIPSVYLDTLLDLPTDSFYMSGLELKVSQDRKIYYSLSPLYSDMSDMRDVRDFMDREQLDFFAAMKLLSTNRFLKLCLDAQQDGDRVILIEDGGYVSPITNQYALEGMTLEEVCSEYFVKVPTNIKGSIKFSEFLDSVLIGSIEHTRNGYERLLTVVKEKSKLYLPAYSIAISNQKVKEESKEVAHSILKAMEDVLHGQGKILSRRKFLILGSSGNIGTFLCKYLRGGRMHDQNDHLIEIDIKTDSPSQWKYNNISQVPEEVLFETDFILGVVGESILDSNFWEKFLINCKSKNIYLASGSTKTVEFAQLTSWLNEFLLGRKNSILGYDVEVEATRIIDPQSQMDQGGIIILQFKKDGLRFEKKLFLLSDLSPVNFLYYGAPTEIMDSIITQLLKVSLGLVDQYRNNNRPKPNLYAVDHEIDVWGNQL